MCTSKKKLQLLDILMINGHYEISYISLEGPYTSLISSTQYETLNVVYIL